jgi:putative acetyltransferase
VRVQCAAFPSYDESKLVESLRRSGNLKLSLVVLEGQDIVGHVAFSPVTVESSTGVVVGLGLAPVAVLPDRQRKGVGAALVQGGLDKCLDRGIPFVVVLGEPSYYRRFGFRAASAWGIANEYNVHDEFMAVELLAGSIPPGGGLARYGQEFSSFA